MEEVSRIIRQARPLYFARKKRRKALAFGTLLAVCVMVVNLPMLWQDSAPVYDVWVDEIYMTENGSPIEDMGLPVDEFGLLMVG